MNYHKGEMSKMLEVVSLDLVPAEVDPKFITNLPINQKGRYERSLMLCGLENSYVFNSYAEDMWGKVLPEHISLYRCAAVNAELEKSFWTTMQEQRIS